MALALMDLETLEMAKKRDHKIMITDEAIEKVPYIRYKEIPEEEYPIIQMLAKKVLQLSKDENESNEVAIIYSMDNPEDEKDAEQCFGIDFGDEHSADPMRDSYSKLLIAVTNMGNIYYLVKTNKFDRQKAIDLFNEAVSVSNKARGLKALQKASEYFLKNCHKTGIIYEDR